MRRGIIFFGLALALIGAVAISQPVGAQSVEEIEARRARLQTELEAEERAIAEQTKLLQAKQRDTATVQGEIDLLKSQIQRAQTSIKAKQVQVSRLADDIVAREGKIETLAQKIKREQGSLGELLRKTRDFDNASFVEILLDNSQLSDFFTDVDDFAFVQRSIHDAFTEMRGAQEDARREKAALEERKNKELDAQKLIEAEQRTIQAKEKDKQVLLNVNKTQEAAYKTILAERQKRAAQIRAALFALRDSAAIPFGKALEYATAAAEKTGVRAALVLAILTQESNLGQNVGTCNRPGDPPEKQWQAIMKPTRDHAPFLRIVGELGISPEGLPLSCPWGGGWGGAMGPAQFIPSTWELFKTRIASALGKKTADPWEPADAFMASSLYLADLGAGAGGFTAERNAACRYYSGRPCDDRAPANTFYGNQVMTKAADIQENMINPLQNL